MSISSRLLAAASLAAVLALLPISTGCDSFVVADCCTCLIEHRPDGSRGGGADISQENCLPPAENANVQDELCGSALGRQVGGDPNAPEAVEVTSLECVESHCGGACGPLQEKGAVFRLFSR